MQLINFYLLISNYVPKINKQTNYFGILIYSIEFFNNKNKLPIKLKFILKIKLNPFQNLLEFSELSQSNFIISF